MTWSQELQVGLKEKPVSKERSLLQRVGGENLWQQTEPSLPFWRWQPPLCPTIVMEESAISSLKAIGKSLGHGERHSRRKKTLLRYSKTRTVHLQGCLSYSDWITSAGDGESHQPTKDVSERSSMPQVADLKHLHSPCEVPLTSNQKNLSIACSSLRATVCRELRPVIFVPSLDHSQETDTQSGELHFLYTIRAQNKNHGEQHFRTLQWIRGGPGTRIDSYKDKCCQILCYLGQEESYQETYSSFPEQGIRTTHPEDKPDGCHKH